MTADKAACAGNVPGNRLSFAQEPIRPQRARTGRKNMFVDCISHNLLL